LPTLKTDSVLTVERSPRSANGEGDASPLDFAAEKIDSVEPVSLFPDESPMVTQ
jgi:hypothetical protein